MADNGNTGDVAAKMETEDHENYGNSAIADAQDGSTEQKSKGKNEDSFSRKIFVGGIGWDTSDEDLKTYFGQYGEVAHVQVKYDHFTGRSRGFAFVEFATGEGCRAALQQKDREIKGKKVEVKAAKSRENKKIFIGGLPSDYSEDQLRAHFEQYGQVDEIEWPFDKFQSKKKNFAFVVFEDEDAAARAAAAAKQRFGDRMCDVKVAVPQYMRPQKQAAGGSWTGYPGGGVVPGGWGDYSGYGYGGYGGGYSYYDDRYASYDYGGYAAPSAGEYAGGWQGYDNWGGYGATGTPAAQGPGGHRNPARGGGTTGGAGAGYNSYY